MQIALKISTPAPALPPGKESKELNCRWKVCKTKHFDEIPYRDNGVLDRPVFPAEKRDDPSLPQYYEQISRWKKAGVDPWTKSGGKKYTVRYHHLIPVSSFTDFSDLSADAILAGYDINDPNNIMALPYEPEDKSIDGLQTHRGGHKQYNKYAESLLAVAEDDCKDWCRNDLSCTSLPQSDALLGRLSLITNTLRSRIISKKIALHKGSTDGI